MNLIALPRSRKDILSELRLLIHYNFKQTQKPRKLKAKETKRFMDALLL